MWKNGSTATNRVARPDLRDRVQLHQVGHQVAVGEHHALGPAGGARGVGQHGDVVGADRRCGWRGGQAEQVVEAGVAVGRRPGRPRRRRRARPPSRRPRPAPARAAVVNDHPGPGVGELGGQLAGGVERVDTGERSRWRAARRGRRRPRPGSSARTARPRRRARSPAARAPRRPGGPARAAAERERRAGGAVDEGGHVRVLAEILPKRNVSRSTAGMSTSGWGLRTGIRRSFATSRCAARAAVRG